MNKGVEGEKYKKYVLPIQKQFTYSDREFNTFKELADYLQSKELENLFDLGYEVLKKIYG